MKVLKLSIIMVFFLAYSVYAMDFETKLIEAIKIAKPTVVYIFPVELKKADKATQEKQGSGSGVVYDKKGYILTNQHVVDHVKEVNVEFIDGTVLVGKVLGIDEVTDQAVVKVEYPNETMSMLVGEAKFGDSTKLQEGQWVIAIGAPFSLKYTVTKGIISAMNRDDIGLSAFEDFIQTDTPINPGNSGGGLFNLNGELVGINTAIINYAQGLGFAVPSRISQLVIPELVKYGRYRRGWIGIGLQDLNKDLAASFGVKEKSGILVNEVFAGSPAEAVKLQVGDIVTKINGIPTPEAYKLKHIVTMMKQGTKVTLEITRLDTESNKRETIAIQLTLAENKDSKPAKDEPAKDAPAK
jgi:serine protease Do